jgi:predicted O-methyltransferase YrrM/catechol 2,3-dioxygenase-like lactoylglutathione lyase family enzyme
MRLDHIQLAAPEQGEDAARAFFSGILGLDEETKPDTLLGRGGVWFRGEDVVLHVGIDSGFQPQKKAHPAFSVGDLDALAEKLEKHNYPVRWDSSLPDVRRFYSADPFGNRIEFIHKSGSSPRRTDPDQWKAVDSYFEHGFVDDNESLRAAREQSKEQGLPQWEVSPLQAQFLKILILATQSRRVLEIGTLGGYSTIFLAQAVGEQGSVVTLEIDEHHAEVAESNIERAGLSDRVTVIVGPAADTMQTFIDEDNEPFDMVFIDADKKSNPEYMRLARRLVSAGALIITDNVVRGGAVVDGDRDDDDLRGVRDLISMLAEDSGSISSAIQTVGSKGYDGFAITFVS